MLTLIVKDKSYPLPTSDEITFAERRRIKAESGMGFVEFQQALGERDPEAEIALIHLALRRQDADADLDWVEALTDADWRILDEEEKPVPPADGAEEAPAETKPPTRRARSGSRRSAASTD